MLVAFVLGVLSNIAVIALMRFADSLSITRTWTNRDPRKPATALLILLILWAAINTGLFFVVVSQELSYWWLVAIPASSVLVIYFMWEYLRKFWSLGIRSVDEEVGKGIDYKKSLQLCKTEFMFMGTGAGKLTKLDEFEEAMYRCRHHKIRLLLCNPDNEVLVSGAKSYGQGPADAYKNIVKDSLRRIADLRERRSLPIEVRFYSGQPLFRLMFIDDSLCLFSYTVLGVGDGAQVPQLHLIKAPQQEDHTMSFYYPLHQYFEATWNSSLPWNFQKYL